MKSSQLSSAAALVRRRVVRSDTVLSSHDAFRTQAHPLTAATRLRSTPHLVTPIIRTSCPRQSTHACAPPLGSGPSILAFASAPPRLPPPRARPRESALPEMV